MDVNTFSIAGIKRFKLSWTDIKFDLVCDYINNSDLSIPVENIVVKVYRLNGESEEELGVSRPNMGVELKAKQTTTFSIPMNVPLGSIGGILKASKYRVRVWITVQGIQIEDVKDISL